MKKLLILAYDFPPYVSVGGLRPHSWYKYLNEFDIYPIVITRQWENKYGNYLDYISPSKTQKTEIEETEYGTIIRTPYKPNLANKIMFKYGENRFKIIRRIISAYYEVFQWFLPVGTKYNLYREADKYLKNNKVDAIIATGEPFILFKYASLLSGKFNIPWVADYRDPWTTNKLRSRNIVLKTFNKFNEKRFTKNVNKIITVSLFFKKQILKVVLNKNISTEIIINGFNKKPNLSKNTKQNSKINIVYVGTVYKWHPIDSFLKVCDDIAYKNNLCLNFYGINIQSKIEKLISSQFINLKDKVKFFPKQSNDILIENLVNNDILLLFNDYSVSGTKIYDYLAVNRKILFCYNHDKNALVLKEKYYNFDDSQSENNHLQKDIIQETNSGVIVEDEQDLSKVLLALIKEFNQKDKIECNAVGIEKYSRKLQVEKLAKIIKEL